MFNFRATSNSMLLLCNHLLCCISVLHLLLTGEAPPTPVPSSNVGRDAGGGINSGSGAGAPRLPGLWVVIIVLVATTLLALNVSAIVCIIKRRRNKREGGSSQTNEKHLSSASKGVALTSTSPHLTRSGKLPITCHSCP